MGISSILILILFSYFALIGLIASIAWSFKNEAAYKMLSTAAGFDLNAVTKTSETTSKAMKFLLLDFTSQMAGFNFFALLILWFPFRNGDWCAWLALWYYPIMFIWHYFHYAKNTSFSRVQIIYSVLSGLSLLFYLIQKNYN